jgi:hypothetical protein
MFNLETRTMEAIARASHRLLETTEVDKQPCTVCDGTGITWHTNMQDMYGMPCLRGCPMTEDALRDQTKGGQG